MTAWRDADPADPEAAATCTAEDHAASSDRAGLRLHCRGVVQGVGFRPAVARLARSLGLDGCLVNIPGAVLIELAGPRPALERLLRQLAAALPAAARLETLQPQWLLPPLPAGLARGTGVRIAAGPPQPLGVGLIAPSLQADQAPCPACLRELRDPENRRCGYPFISCCSCGPRYSIATAEPFARAHTTLAGFRLCPACQAEFDDPADRRYHAETIGCPACGPRLRLLDGGGRLLAGSDSPHQGRCGVPGDPLGAAVDLLRSGAILALQGVGGFQLLVDASNAKAVARLRARKRRPHKPFALLVDRAERLAALVQPSPAERAALQDPAAPIVLLACPDASHEQTLAGVAPGALGLGVMLPASPLHLLLAEAFAGPLVATSGNRSGEPLCLDPDEAQERLAGLAEAFLLHDRPIARPLDDSLLQVIDGRPALLRRARGYAPAALELRCEPEATDPPPTLLALGSDLKNAPALACADRLWLAPHLGDLADARCLERWRGGIGELLERHQGAGLAVAVDAHPGYVSTQLAAGLLQAYAARGRITLQPVAHHRAHGLAVVAEHGLPLPLAALLLDGLGYGGGTVPLWGCELLWLMPGGARRLGSLRPFPLPGGEKAVREPRRSGLGLLRAAGLLDHRGASAVRQAFDAADLKLLNPMLDTGCNSPWCSSAGRLFDAVAALLNLVRIASHDAHAGLLLQTAAARAPAKAGAYPLPLQRPCPGPGALSPPPPEPGEDGDLPRLDWQPLLESLLDDLAAARPVDLCAARFHNGLSEGLAAMVASLAAPGELPGEAVVLAGGCFQNRLLLEGLIEALRQRGLRPLWAEQLPGHDGGLAAGQILALRQGVPTGGGNARPGT